MPTELDGVALRPAGDGAIALHRSEDDAPSSPPVERMPVSIGTCCGSPATLGPPLARRASTHYPDHLQYAPRQRHSSSRRLCSSLRCSIASSPSSSRAFSSGFPSRCAHRPGPPASNSPRGRLLRILASLPRCKGVHAGPVSLDLPRGHFAHFDLPVDWRDSGARTRAGRSAGCRQAGVLVCRMCWVGGCVRCAWVVRVCVSSGDLSLSPAARQGWFSQVRLSDVRLLSFAFPFLSGSSRWRRGIVRHLMLGTQVAIVAIPSGEHMT